MQSIFCSWRSISWACVRTLVVALALVGCGVRHSKVASSSDHARPGGNRYVVVLSLDGFRSDYQAMAHTPHLDAMDREGLSGIFRPCFPSLTFPNHYAMATGLHPNNHGLVGNEFWDERGKHYRLSDRAAVEDPAFYFGEPLWNTARRQGVRTASFFWVGSETAIGRAQPNIWKKFDNRIPYRERADSVLSWLQMPEGVRPHLIMWYLEEPDHTGHHHSPESPKTAEMIQQVDSVVGYFRHQLAQLPIASQVDFVLVSDHGMMTFERVVNLGEYISLDDLEHYSGGPFTHLYPKPGKAEEILAKLQTVEGIKAMRKGELPARLHYGTSPRTGEIVVMGERGTTIVCLPAGAKVKSLAAGHGFDNEYPEMLALFKAVGPSFRPGSRRASPVLNITLYPLVCQLLGITPAPNDADEALARSLHQR